jgi:hypothetical protein
VWKRIGCGSDSVLSISIFIFSKQIRILSNTNAERMLFKYECGLDVFQYGTDMNNKIIDLYLIVSQVYNDIIHNSLKSSNKKKILTTFLAFLVR